MDRINVHRPSVRSARPNPTALPSTGTAESAEVPGRSATPGAAPGAPSAASGSGHAPGEPGTGPARANPRLNPNAASYSPVLPQPSHPVSPRTARMHQMTAMEASLLKPQSRHNGYKLMPPHLQEAVRQSQQILPPNIGVPQPNSREYSVIFHQNPMTGRLEAGSRMGGSDNSVDVPLDIYWPTARVHVHSHPYRGTGTESAPSMPDQKNARKLPHIDFLVQSPTTSPGAPNEYTLYKGTFPPRHYTLVENPQNLPVRPDSPDMDSMPPYKPHPYS
jgi:hypothetical protein